MTVKNHAKQRFMVLALELEGNFQIAAANLGEGDQVGVGWERTHPLVDAFGGDHRLTVSPVNLDSDGNHVPASADWAGDHRITATPKHLPPAEELEGAVANFHRGCSTLADGVCRYTLMIKT